jgi:hypothetical protein
MRPQISPIRQYQTGRWRLESLTRCPNWLDLVKGIQLLTIGLFRRLPPGYVHQDVGPLASFGSMLG